jgi:uncharacterized membrane protein
LTCPDISPSIFRQVSAGLAIVLLTIATAWAGDDRDIDVRVSIDSGVVRVFASLRVEAGMADTWAVMTDFDRMASFISNLKSSRVLSRSGNNLVVEQGGEANFGPLSYKFESTREIRLWPGEGVQSRMLKGNMERFEGMTRFTPDGTGTRIRYQSESVPGRWIPPLVGTKFIERETREQLSEFRVEIERRKRDQNREAEPGTKSGS